MHEGPRRLQFITQQTQMKASQIITSLLPTRG
jgi:hypothetical protein